jgi:hypothetical protein
MTRGIAVLAVVIALLACACDGADVAGSPKPVGALSYSGYDEAGRVVVVGWISLDLVTIYDQPHVGTSGEFAGAWELHALVDPTRVGPQNGRGDLAGRIVEEGVAVDLNPDRVDDNVVLFGIFSAGGPAGAQYEGKWSWQRLGGVRAEGTFRATE